MGAQAETTTSRADLRQEFEALCRQMAEARAAGLEIAQELKSRHQELARQMSGRARPRARKQSPQPSPLKAEVITDRSVLAELQPQWNDMLERGGNPSPFVTWEWWWTWLEHCGKSHEPYVLVAREGDGRLVAGLPLTIAGGRRGEARFMGSFEGPDPAYLCFPAAGERAGEARGLVLDQLRRDCGVRFASWRWDHCGVNGPFGDIISQTALRGLQATVQVRKLLVNGPLPNSYDEFISNVPSKNRRSELRRQFERLEQEWAPPEFGVYRELSPEAGTLMEYMAQYNIRRLDTLGEYSRWKNESFNQCLSRIAERFSERGWFRLFTISVEGRLAAALMGWAYHDTFFAYQIGETHQHPGLGIGQCVIAHTIRSCIEEGIKHFEFLGEAHGWKRRYFEGATPSATVRFGKDDAAYWASTGKYALRRAVGKKLREVRHGA